MSEQLIGAEAKLQEVREAAKHPFKGPNDTDASMLREAAKRLDGNYEIGGQWTRATVAKILRVVANSILDASDE